MGDRHTHTRRILSPMKGTAVAQSSRGRAGAWRLSSWQRGGRDSPKGPCGDPLFLWPVSHKLSVVPPHVPVGGAGFLGGSRLWFRVLSVESGSHAAAWSPSWSPLVPQKA